MSGLLTEEKFKELKQNHNEIFIFSRFNFLNSHNGFRRGEVHNFIAPQGGSKSSMCRSIICEVIGQNKKVFLHLSEETWDSYVFSMNELLRKSEPDNFENMLSNLSGISEMSGKNDLKLDYWKMIYQTVLENSIDLFVIDNWTTSFLGMDSISKQDANAKLLKRLAIACNIPVVVLCHSSKNTDAEKQIIRSEDVRGSASTVNIGSYNYIIQTMYNLTPAKTFVLVDKARHHSRANKKIYELTYNSAYGIFKDDKITSREELRSCLKKK